MLTLPPAAPETASTPQAFRDRPLPSFFPRAPKTLDATHLNTILIEDLLLRTLMQFGSLLGRQLSRELAIPHTLMEPLLADLKQRMLIVHKSSGQAGDFIYMLSDIGLERAQKSAEQNSYVGPAPVAFEDYLRGVQSQSIRLEKPGASDLQKAFQDLCLDDSMFEVLGPAINSGRGLFIYGAPGNGKTSIAERICRCFQGHIYIPKAVLVGGQLIQLYDPQCHEAIALDTLEAAATDPSNADKAYDAISMMQVDQRWIRIKRPVVMVGGELTLESLEIQYNPLVKMCEAPLQMKANGGVFLIDDFGRQRVSHEALLNRWIVPLEKRVDFLTLPTGKKIEVPFDTLILFSTNLNPKDLVDDAFLRRIPYKIHVADPSEAAFRRIFEFMAPRYNVAFDPDMFEYLLATHYRGKRPFRACQARDILEQIVNACAYRRQAPVMTPALLDAACHTYFAAMGNAPDEAGEGQL